jgi:hypothetical protein
MSSYHNEHCKKHRARVVQDMYLFTKTLHAVTPTEQSDHTAAVKASYLAEGFIYGITFLRPPNAKAGKETGRHRNK